MKYVLVPISALIETFEYRHVPRGFDISFLDKIYSMETRDLYAFTNCSTSIKKLPPPLRATLRMDKTRLPITDNKAIDIYTAT